MLGPHALRAKKSAPEGLEKPSRWLKKSQKAAETRHGAGDAVVLEELLDLRRRGRTGPRLVPGVLLQHPEPLGAVEGAALVELLLGGHLFQPAVLEVIAPRWSTAN